MKLFIFILPLFFCSVLFAQQAPDPKNPASVAKFNIIKRSIEFLSTDTESFKGIKTNVCKGCTDYFQVNQFAEKMTNASPLVNRWKKIKVGNNGEELKAFKDSVLKDITTGSARKENRKKFPGYAGYEKEIDAFIAVALAAAKPASATTEQAADTAQASTPPTEETPGTEVDNTAEQEPIPPAVPVDTDKKDIPWLFVGAALVGLLLAVYFYLDAQKQRSKRATAERKLKEHHEELNNREREYLQLKNEVNKLKEELAEERNKFEELSEKQVAERRRNQQKEKDARQPAPAAPEPSVNLSKGFMPMVKYARYADKGDGFSSADLLDQDDNETIFEITITSPATGAFRISNNRQAQRYALSNASYFFGNTCLYDALPAADSVIVTNTPGELVLNGDKWTIRNPAKISFN